MSSPYPVSLDSVALVHHMLANAEVVRLLRDALSPGEVVQTPWLNAVQAADYLAMDVRGIYRLIEDGRLPRYGTRRHLLVRREDLDRVARHG